MRSKLGAALLTLLCVLGAASWSQAQGPFSAQIQRALAQFQASNPVFQGAITLVSTTQTTADVSYPLFAGVTDPRIYYTKSSTNTSLTLASGLARAAGFINYYKFAPTDSDAAGLDRVAAYDYLETGGSQNLSADIFGAQLRALHLGTGSVHGIWGTRIYNFNGHAGAQGSTGGPITTYQLGLQVGVFQQSNAATVPEQLGITIAVENDYGAPPTESTGLRVDFLGPILPITSYGVYLGPILGTTKYSFYASDAAAPSYLAGDLESRSVRGTTVAFASLPATPVEGMLVGVNNSNTATWGATIAGGGANHVLAYYNGTNWTVAGK